MLPQRIAYLATALLLTTALVPSVLAAPGGAAEAGGPVWADGLDGERYLVGLHTDPRHQRGDLFHGAEVIDASQELQYLTVRTGDEDFADRARQDPQVRYVERDSPEALEAHFVPDDPSRSKQWGWGPAPGIDAYSAWDTTLGSRDVVVAVLDTGLDKSHPDIGNYLQGYDFVEGDNNPDDECGHGTHVAGTVGAITNNGRGVAGTAQTTIMPVKVLDKTGSGGCSGSFGGIADGVVYAVDNGADVITMSLGCSGCSSSTASDAFAYAVSKGVLVVSSAGNSGPCSDCVGFPANDRNVMAVSALESDGDMASFSSNGPEVEIGAPGRSILSTVPGGGYGYKSGTSMAAPHVAGVAALVLATGDLTGAELRDRLKSTAVDIGLSSYRQGAGAVNAAQAIFSDGSSPTPNVPPNASFTHQCWDMACSLDGSASSDEDGTITEYRWTFQDGHYALGETFNHTWADPGTYEVALEVTDDRGATDTASVVVDIPAETGNQAPTAAFTQRCDVLLCSFDASGSSDADGAIERYAWDFGDGNTSTGATVDHTFAAVGSYDVTLTVTDDHGANDTVTKTVRVDEPNKAPTAVLEVTGCWDMTCLVDGSASSDDDGIAEYRWTFEDGHYALGSSFNHTWADAGNYTVTLKVTDTDGVTDTASQTLTVPAGDPPQDPPENQPPVADVAASCSDLTCQLDASGSSDSDGTIAGHSWDLGDGSTATGATVSHTFAAPGNYTVTVTVTDDAGATDTAQTTVSVTAPPEDPANGPTARFTVDCSDRSCWFKASDSERGDAQIVEYAWDFGDGNTDKGLLEYHKYAQDGTYEVTLTVTDTEGRTDSVTKSATAGDPPEDPPENQPPTADLTHACSELACSFDGSGSSDADGTIAGYAWSFGDGNSATGATPSHTYAAAGNYTVTLTVTDDAGATDSAQAVVSVTAPPQDPPEDPPENQPPVADVAASCSDLTCQLDASGSSDADGSIASYSWDLGDGSTATGATVSHTFAAPGNYTVTVTVTDDAGATDTAQTTVTVSEPPQDPPEDPNGPTARISANCSDRSCWFKASDSERGDAQIVEYAWDFGDGNGDDDLLEYHKYAEPGTYEVTLTVTDTEGRTDSVTKTIDTNGGRQ